MKLTFSKVRSVAAKEIKSIGGNTPNEGDIGFITLFIIYSYYRLKHDEDKGLDLFNNSFSHYLLKEIGSLTEHSDKPAYLFDPLKAAISEAPERIDHFARNVLSHLDQVPAAEGFDDVVTQAANSICRDTNELMTPSAILDLLKSFIGSQLSGKLLDLNARTGEWSAKLLNGNNSKTINVSSVCFNPYHHTLLKMRQKLDDGRYQNPLLSNKFDLSQIQQNTFDIVISNPPFGIPGSFENQDYQGTQEAFFLQHALTASKQAGKIICIVPEGFLFRTQHRRNEDYHLRKQLTNDNSIKAIIRLPDSAFLPYARIRTAVLIIDKSKSDDKVSIIDINVNPAELTPRELNEISTFEGTSLDEQRIRVANISSSEIVANNYDWEVQRYLPSSVDKKHRSLKEIKQVLESKEAQLKKVQLEIEEITLSMEVNK